MAERSDDEAVREEVREEVHEDDRRDAPVREGPARADARIALRPGAHHVVAAAAAVVALLSLLFWRCG